MGQVSIRIDVGETAKALMRRRGELIERSFAHLYDTGGMRRVHLRGKTTSPSALIHAAAFNLSMILRQILRVGTARQAADLLATFWLAFLSVTQAAKTALQPLGPPVPLDRAFRKKNRYQSSRRQIETLSTGC